MSQLVTQSTLLASALSGPLIMAALALGALSVAYLLLARAARGRSSSAGAPDADSAGAAGLRHELLANYERLRRAGEALPLAIDVWQRVRGRSDILPAKVADQVAQAYHAIEVANRLLAAASAYDSRGHLSIRQRKLSLWPTLETAVRSALESLGCEVTRAVQAQARPIVTDMQADVSSVSAARPVAAFNMAAAPRLALFHSPDAPTASPSVARPRTAKKKRVAYAASRPDDHQMALWESVA